MDKEYVQEKITEVKKLLMEAHAILFELQTNLNAEIENS